MKKAFVILSFVSVVVACGSNDSAQNAGSTDNAAGGEATTEQTTEAPAATDLSSNPDYKAGLALEAKSDCATCHKLDEKLIGPSFREIAAKYTNDEATVSMLADKIIKGGSGNWGQIPMTPHPDMSTEDAQTIVKYILLLKK